MSNGTEQEIEWVHLVEGDQLKSVNNGKFYLVRRVQAIVGGKVRIELDIPGVKPIERPTVKEPRAIVKRGQTGRAVDVFVSVFSSG